MENASNATTEETGGAKRQAGNPEVATPPLTPDASAHKRQRSELLEEANGGLIEETMSDGLMELERKRLEALKLEPIVLMELSSQEKEKFNWADAEDEETKMEELQASSKEIKKEQEGHTEGQLTTNPEAKQWQEARAQLLATGAPEDFVESRLKEMMERRRRAKEKQEMEVTKKKEEEARTLARKRAKALEIVCVVLIKGLSHYWGRPGAVRQRLGALGVDKRRIFNVEFLHSCVEIMVPQGYQRDVVNILQKGGRDIRPFNLVAFTEKEVRFDTCCQLMTNYKLEHQEQKKQLNADFEKLLERRQKSLAYSGNQEATQSCMEKRIKELEIELKAALVEVDIDFNFGNF